MDLNEIIIQHILMNDRMRIFLKAIESADNNFSDNDDEFEDENYKIEDNILKKFYFQIIAISKDLNFFSNSKNQIHIIKKNLGNIIKDNLPVDKHNILITLDDKYKNMFIDSIVQTKKFSKLELKEIKNNYPPFEELYEFKIIFEDFLKNKCQLGSFLDYKGNLFSLIKDYKIGEKGKNINYWIGFGLNVKEKFDNGNIDWLDKNSEWITAFHGVGGKLSSNQVKDKLIKKIKNGINQGGSQTKLKYEDKRHIGKRVGTGVYLTPNLKILENYCGIITYNKKKYLVALMTKVKIDKIREPKEINFIWVLPKNYVRAYCILFKKI